MKTLEQLVKNFDYSVYGQGSFSQLITNVCSDSRSVIKASLFVAIPGFKTDGYEYVKQAIEKGATVIVSEKPIHATEHHEILNLCVKDSRLAFTQLISAFNDFPAQQLKLIGVTGTNGKTTTTFLIHHVINSVKRAGLVGTVFYDDGLNKTEAPQTTPAPEVLHGMFKTMADRHLEYCVMEVSSHALDQNRTAGLQFSSAIFTNLTQDHLDYHKDFETYYLAKRKLFISPNPPTRSIINKDDSYGARLLADIKESKMVTYGTNPSCDYFASNIKMSWKKLEFVISNMGKTFQIVAPLVLMHNVYNVLAAFAACCEEGISPDQIVKALQDFPGVPGRMEQIDEGQEFSVFVDYAHTPDAIFNVLSAAKDLPKARLITVFGCGGDRDKGKRPLMGKIASERSDLVIITSDNPRSENAEAIIEQIEHGIDFTNNKTEVLIIPVRKEAIEKALSRAKKDDVVFIFGKGHENYQIIGSEKSHFSDQETVRNFLRAKCLQ